MRQLAVLDTDVVSILFRNDSRAAFYEHEVAGRNCFISFMTVAELDRWTLRHDWGPAKRSLLEGFVSKFTVYSSDRQLSFRWAEVVEAGRKLGRPVNCADAWIAATALELDCPLVTHNFKDFQALPGLIVRSHGGLT